MSDTRVSSGLPFWAGLMKAKPAKPGEIYGVPGQGDSLRISAVVIAGLIFFWWLVTYFGVVKPALAFHFDFHRLKWLDDDDAQPNPTVSR